MKEGKNNQLRSRVVVKIVICKCVCTVHLQRTIILPEFSDSLYFKCAALKKKKKIVKIFCVESCRKCDKPSNCSLALSEGEFVIILLRIIYLVDRFYRK